MRVMTVVLKLRDRPSHRSSEAVKKHETDVNTQIQIAELRELPLVGAQRPSRTSDVSEYSTLWKHSQYSRSSRATRQTRDAKAESWDSVCSETSNEHGSMDVCG